MGLNNGSVVIRLTYGSSAVLLTGDIEQLRPIRTCCDGATDFTPRC